MPSLSKEMDEGHHVPLSKFLLHHLRQMCLQSCEKNGNTTGCGGICAGRRIMTRSQRKRAKNQRIAIAKGLERQAKRINATAKFWAVRLTTDQRGKELWGRLGKCPSCGFYYCFAYGGSIVWCFECRYYPCLKITEACDPLIKQQCNPCRWEERDAKNLS